MKVINSSNIMCVDIDDTLIMWKSPKYAEPRNKLCFTFNGKYVIKYIRENTVEELKRQKESGRYVDPEVPGSPTRSGAAFTK